MGTRSMTYIMSDHGTSVLASIYRQFDGYPSSHGQDLAKILEGRRICNGFSPDTPENKYSNGMGCLAATVIMKLKEVHGIGGIYLTTPPVFDSNSDDHRQEKLTRHGKSCWAEYIYVISPGKNDCINMKVFEIGCDKPIFNGSPDDFKYFEEDDDDDI